MQYGLIGRPLGHSFSPPIHHALADYDYRLFELEENEVAAFVRRDDIGGLNVTIPYKQTVIPLCDALSPQAARIGSVNTLVYDRDRRITGHNTDYAGLCWLLRRAGIDPRGKKAALLGNGGVCRTVRTVFADLGAREIVVLSRHPGEDTVSYADTAAYADAELVVNTTPVGMFPHCPDAPISLAAFPRCEGFVDMIYNPLRTALCFEAAARGIPTSNGLPMLVAQAKAAAELFTGSSIPDERTEEVLCALERQQENVVLVGMPGSGKSTVAKALATALGREWVDLDAEVERAAGMSVPALFEKGGEPLFREWEHRIVCEQGRRSGLVIATGGGVIKDAANYRPLAQNGRVVFLTRDLQSLPTDGRPLSTGTDALRTMFAERLPLYRAFCDVEVSNDRPLDETVAAIREEFA